MSDPNSTSLDILSDGPGKYILRPVTALKLIRFTLQVYTSKLTMLVKLMVVSCKKEEIYFNELMV
jgi:hypothetical protein